MPIKKRDEDAESVNSSSNGSVRNAGRRSRQSVTNKVCNQIVEQLRTQPVIDQFSLEIEYNFILFIFVERAGQGVARSNTQLPQQ